MVSDSFAYAATFLASGIFGQWLGGFVAILLAGKIISFLLNNLK